MGGVVIGHSNIPVPAQYLETGQVPAQTGLQEDLVFADNIKEKSRKANV